VMLEAVQNHGPDVIIVDEIGSAEVGTHVIALNWGQVAEGAAQGAGTSLLHAPVAALSRVRSGRTSSSVRSWRWRQADSQTPAAIRLQMRMQTARPLCGVHLSRPTPDPMNGLTHGST
jgi:hypothetical protein